MKDSTDDEPNISWLHALIAEMERYSDGSRFLNVAGFQEEGDAMMVAAFGHRYERLVSLKNQYDSGNLFSLNQNIAHTPLRWVIWTPLPRSSQFNLLGHRRYREVYCWQRADATL